MVVFIWSLYINRVSSKIPVTPRIRSTYWSFTLGRRSTDNTLIRKRDIQQQKNIKTYTTQIKPFFVVCDHKSLAVFVRGTTVINADRKMQLTAMILRKMLAPVVGFVIAKPNRTLKYTGDGLSAVDINVSS